MSSGSDYKGQQKGRCTDCKEKTVEKADNGKCRKWCGYYGNWCQFVAWNCTVNYVRNK